MPTTAKYTTYGQVTFLEKVTAMASMMLHLRESSSCSPVAWFTTNSFTTTSTALVLGWTFSTSPFYETNRNKPWPRIAVETAARHAMQWINVRQLQWLNTKSSREVYEACAKEHNLPVLIDELGSDGRLLWLGERRTDNVILYVHGG